MRGAGVVATEGVELSLVLPAYNEGPAIERTIGNAVKALEKITPCFEIIVVNDGSLEETGGVLDRIAAATPQLRPIHLRRNVGQHIATVVGLRRARGRYIVTADADEQVPFTSVATLHRAAQSDPKADIVSGARSTRNVGLYRGLGSKMVTRIVNRSLRQPLKDPATTFRLFRRSALEEILNADALTQNIPILVGHLGLTIREVDVVARADGGRKSSYSFLRLVHVLLLALLNFSSGTTTLLTLMAAGFLSFSTGSAGLAGIVLWGIIAQVALPTNWLLFFVLLVVLGLQFVLVGAVAYKIERLNMNLRFRQQLDVIRHDRVD